VTLARHLSLLVLAAAVAEWIIVGGMLARRMR